MTWPPLTEADISAALEAGDVSESNRLDFKALVGDTSSARKETAKDLASFAVDGGALLIGIREDKLARTFHPAPVDLRDVVERIEQIAGNRVDPPLVVRPREIASEQDGLGYVWVDIPSSPDAPHMVDGRYYGRGERTNRTLSDADVLRLHRQRRDAKEEIRTALTALQERDPFPSARPGASAAVSPASHYGHLYLVAEPRQATPGLAESLVRDRTSTVRELILAAGSGVPEKLEEWISLIGGISTVPRASAVSVTNLGGDDLRRELSESYGWEVRVGTEASLGYTFTGATRPPSDDPAAARVFDAAVLASTWHLLEIARRIAHATRFAGTWDIGLRITRLQGCRSPILDDQFRFRNDGVAYDEPEYERIASATLADLDSPDATVKQLTRPLLRALASWNSWERELPELAADKSP